VLAGASSPASAAGCAAQGAASRLAGMAEEARRGATRFEEVRQQAAQVFQYVDDIVVAFEGETEPVVLPRIRLDQGRIMGLEHEFARALDSRTNRMQSQSLWPLLEHETPDVVAAGAHDHRGHHPPQTEAQGADAGQRHTPADEQHRVAMARLCIVARGPLTASSPGPSGWHFQADATAACEPRPTAASLITQVAMGFDEKQDAGTPARQWSLARSAGSSNTSRSSGRAARPTMRFQDSCSMSGQDHHEQDRRRRAVAAPHPPEHPPPCTTAWPPLQNYFEEWHRRRQRHIVAHRDAMDRLGPMDLEEPYDIPQQRYEPGPLHDSLQLHVGASGAASSSMDRENCHAALLRPVLCASHGPTVQGARPCGRLGRPRCAPCTRRPAARRHEQPPLPSIIWIGGAQDPPGPGNDCRDAA